MEFWWAHLFESNHLEKSKTLKDNIKTDVEEMNFRMSG
jgi:hypothetical protein